MHIIVAVALLINAANGAVAWGLYYLHADKAAVAACVNPRKPACHGRCQMARKTDQQNQQNRSTPQLHLGQAEPGLVAAHPLPDPPAYSPEKPTACAIASQTADGHTSTPFQPPQVFVV